MAKILLVDDDFVLCESIESSLTPLGFVVDCANTVEIAEEMLLGFEFDLIVLDWVIPPATGIDFLEKIRAKGVTTPVIMLTGKGTIDERSQGLETGADDYLVKPFHMKELVARIRAVLRRPASYSNSVITMSGISLDTQTVRVEQDGHEIKLTRQEYLLLEYLMKNANRVFSQEVLATRVWPTMAESTPDTVRVHMSRMRRKLSSDGRLCPIKTVRGTGYIFVSDDE
ncbi:MAG: response regulator transcription factor [Cyanobacteria bacterium]|nr:response regulator transcription factor [Cyanobacteriota bacterium]